MFFDDLDELDNILDKINPDEEKIKLNGDDLPYLTDEILNVMYDYIDNNPVAMIEEDFHETFVDDVTELMKLQLGYNDDDSDDDNNIEILEDVIEDALEYFYENFMPERSYANTFTTDNHKERDIITMRLEYLRNKPQPAQRTDEWYVFRHNLITASNAYKAFEGECTRNQLIYEKCQPLNIFDKSNFVNINTPFHHGQKYEPLSVMLYEEKYGVKVGDFGCIQHDKYPFLGASPDGINIDINSPTYGRMLEIKNIVNRIIDGIPKKEYWVQMQLQMETCDLNECDFLETKFVDYLDTDDSSAREKFMQDGDFHMNEKKQRKGIILYFAKQDGNPHYIYCPLKIQDIHSFEKWEDSMIDLYQGPEYNLNWIKNVYWRLEQFSCVLVLRNKEWFSRSIGKLQEVWNIIEKERVTGYAHRAPNKRVKKESPLSTPEQNGCLLNFDKAEGKFVVSAQDLPKVESQKVEVVIKVRTQSFDDSKNNL